MNEKYCGNCGTLIEEGLKLCPHCGKSLEISESLSQPITPPESEIKISDIKEKIWTIPVISGILTLISLLFPSAYSTIETPFVKIKINSYLWIWGFGYSIKGFVWIEKEDFFALSLLISFCILITACSLIGISRQFGKKKLSVSITQIFWIGIGILQIFLVIFWIISFELIFPGIWAVYNFGFGIIGIFISAVLSIISGIIIGTLEIEIPKKEKEEIIPKEKKKYKPEKIDYFLFGLLGLFAFLIILGIYYFLIGK